MAKKKKPENETPEQKETRQLIDTIANAASRGAKVQFDRRMDNMVSLLASLKPIEDKILDLMAQKQPIIDEIDALRKLMVHECVHPQHVLTHKDGIVYCKFCNRSFKPL